MILNLGFKQILLVLVVSISLSAQLVAQNCDPAPSGLIGWWPGDGNANDISGGHNATLSGGATANTAAYVAQGFRFDGTNSYVQIPDSTALHPTNLTIEAWVRFTSLTSSGSANTPAGLQYIIFKQNSRSIYFEGFYLAKVRNGSVDNFSFGVTSAAGAGASVDSTAAIATNVWYHIAGVRGPSSIQLFVNGVSVGSTTVTFAQNYGTLPLFFGSTGVSTFDRKLNGMLDEVSLYNRALSASEIAAIYAAGASGKCKGAAPPGFVTQPQSQTVAVGGNAAFSVTASGATPLSYQWLKNSANIANATASSFSLTNVQADDAGNFSVIVTNSSGSATSALAVLTIVEPPGITTPPQSQSVAVGANVSFSVTATGSAPLSYQWKKNSANIANATGSSFALSNVQPTDGGNFSVVVTNAGGSVTSAVAVLNILAPPSITGQPQNQNVILGGNASFSVTATGSAPLSYQWQKEGVEIDSATSSSFSLANAQATDGGNFSVIVTNPLGSATSAVAVLTIIVPPSITAQPQSLTNIAGSTAVFSATAVGSAPLSYQWRFNSTNLANGGRISGATSSSLTVSMVQAADAGSYVLVVTNPGGSTNSIAAVLTVNGPPVITAQPANQSVAPGANVSFSVTASGTQPLAYAWQRNGVNLADGGNITGSGLPTLGLANVQTNDAASYRVVITNIAGAATSSVASLTVTAPGNCFTAPSGLLGWWPGDGAANDIFSVNNGSLQGGATATGTGLVAQAFTFDGVNSYVQIPDSAALHPTNLTIECWVKFASLDSTGSGPTPAGMQYIVFKQNTHTYYFEGFYLTKVRNGSVDNFEFGVTSAGNVNVSVDSTAAIVTNVWYHIAGVRGPSSIQLYVNGVSAGSATVNFPQDYGTLPLYFGTSGQAIFDRKLNGMLDEVSLYNRALSAAEIAAIYNAGSGGKCKGPGGPSIVTQPASQVLVTGGTATFTVTAVGSPPLGYQWYKDSFKLTNGGNISGATSAALSVSSLSSSDIGNYQVIVTNAYGSVTSAVASLNTGTPPANDNFASAVAISGSSGSVKGNNANGTKQSGEPNHAGNAGGVSVWYNWTAPSTSPVTFDTALSSFDTLLAVYTGSSVSALTAIASNNDISSNNVRSRLTFTPVSGTVYRIAVDGANGANGNLTLRWAQASVGLPNLSLVASAVNPHITTETFSPSSCAVMEGLIQAGTRTLIRFDTQTENSGSADLFFGNPANNPLFVWAPCHAHYHFQNYMSYRLRDSSGKIAAVGLKVGFCILDVFRWSSSAPSNAKYTCTNQGIQVGWGDLYDSTLDGQWIDITGLPAGNYTMELEANPQGIIQESDYSNNLTTVPITIGNPNAAPLNDNFASSQALLGGFSSVSGNSANATKQSGEPNHAGNTGGRSVWYSWTAPSTKSVTIDTIGSSFNTLLAVYTGSAVGSLSLVASNDDIAVGNTQSRVTFNAIANTTYQIAVDGSGGASGNLILTLNQTIQNDNYANCQFVGGVSGIAYGSDLGATKESGEPNHAGNAGGTSIWYCWTAPINGTVTFDTTGSTFNTLLAVYTGSSVNSLTPIASNDDIDAGGGNLQSRVSFTATGLTMYHIAIDGFNGATGDTTLNWNLVANGTTSLAAQQNIAAISLNGGPKLASSFLSEGEFQLMIAGQPQQRYQIEVSCDLAHWAPTVSTLADESGIAYFTDKTTMNSGSQSATADPVCGSGTVLGAATTQHLGRFYRAIPIPPSN